MPNSASDLDQRVLIHAPYGRDGVLLASILDAAAIKTRLCESLSLLLEEARRGLGAIIITQESLTQENLCTMASLVTDQAPWSDFPILVFLSRGEHDEARAAKISQMLGNVTVLERPLSRFTLVSATHAALRARNRQYQVRELLQRQDNEILLRDQFLAMLGHELRNPLAAISNAVDVSRLRLPKDQDVPRPLQVMRRQCDHLARLVNDLLDVSRVTSGKVNLSRHVLDLRTLLVNALGPLEPLFAAQDITLTCDPGELPLLVNADATRLEQVFTNLLTNALKYTPHGGRVNARACREGDLVLVCVSDTGVGLSPQMISQVFELFVQSERSLERAQGGLGIGLTVARNLVELHGGHISATSQGEGRGAQFTVTLPAADALLVPVQGAEVSEDNRRPSTLHVLVVEDNDDNREGLKELLEAFGYRVDVAMNGEQGLHLALQLRPNVILVDIGLPNLDGYQVAERLRGALGDAIRLVALTGYGQPEDIRRTSEAGFDTHLTKPASVEELLAALRQDAAAVNA